MQIFKIFACMLLLLSCSRNVEEKTQHSDNATFIVDPITSIAEADKSNANFNSISTERILNFTACLKDVAVLEPIISQKFSIFDGKQEITNKTTDSKGCLYWTESFQYNSLSQENYIEVQRTVMALSSHKGSQTIRLAINPWKNGSGTSVDLRFQNAPKGMMAKKEERVGIHIESASVDLEITKSSNSVAEANLRLSFEPKIRRLSLEGSPVFENLTKGKLNIKSQLFVRNIDGKEKFIYPLSEISERIIKYENNIALSEEKIKIIRKIPRESIVEMNLEVAPIEGPEDLGKVRGTLTIGRMTSLSISQKTNLKEENFSFTSPLQISNLEKNKELSMDYIIGTVKISNFSVKELDENQNPLSIILQYESCMKNAINHEAILNGKFSISANNNEGEQFITDPDSGCLHWKETLPFDFYAKENFIPREFTFQSTEIFYGNDKKTRKIFINPWDIVQGKKGIYDEFYEGSPPTLPVNGPKSGAELILSSIYFNYNDRTFKIDSQLNLSVIRNYRFEIRPIINKTTSTGVKSYGTGNGKFKIKFLMETMDRDAPEIIDIKEVLTESRGDAIVATVDFEYKDIRQIQTRTNLTVEVEAIGNTIETKPYTGTFDAINGFAVRLEPRHINLAEKVKLSEKPNGLAKFSGAQIYSKILKTTTIDEDKVKELGINKNLIVDGNDKKSLGKLCALFFDPNGFWSPYKNCTVNPDSFLGYFKTEHISKVFSSKLSSPPDSSSVTISAGLNFSETESQDRSKGKTSNIALESRLGAGASIPGLKIIGLDIGASIGVAYGKSWFWSESTSQGKTRSTYRSQDRSKQITVDETHFKIDAEIEKCLTVQDKTKYKELKIYFLCSDKKERRIVLENYYYIFQYVSSSAFGDQGAVINERPLVALIRGTERFNAFLKILQDPNFTISFTKELPAANNILQETENRNDGFFPGLLTPKE